ncbi:SPFH domain-containing protein [Leadbettera azotonutricia]|uniref:Spfh/band 7 domain protein n=1 Tax=Leadbettera azotonutricia (strain ATCC BAA-888 / DSM 13862 / ZAS-9) TaxID=545695 RepID=F5YFS7_LEAAZ|nr:SPFH domain-containing protein [Leadbettera azotonutricia]AEF82795.1 spfh/band 7 domain protein [Leadbettera azotonutricia ZAS-9]
MFGFRFVKFEPGLYVFRYKKGRIAAQGEGLSFWYYAPTTSLVAVPVGSADAPFMFAENSSDFQALSIQGQLTFRIADPAKTAKMLNYTVDDHDNYVSDDPQKLPDRLISLVQITVKGAVKKLLLKEAITASDEVAQQAYKALAEHVMVTSLGVEILSVTIAAIKPNPETAKALEAETREAILKESDQAIFQRRNYAVEQERIIRESELNTEIAVENKNREIQETRLETEAQAQRKRLSMEEAQLAFMVQQEERNKELVDLKARNEKIEADTKAYALRELMKVYQEMDVETLKALSNGGLDSGRLMALAFQGIADKAEKIGNLNITPDLLSTIIQQNPQPRPRSDRER